VRERVRAGAHAQAQTCACGRPPADACGAGVRAGACAGERHGWIIVGPRLVHVWTKFGDVCALFGPCSDHVSAMVTQSFDQGLTCMLCYIASNSYYWDAASILVYSRVSELRTSTGCRGRVGPCPNRRRHPHSRLRGSSLRRRG
jgi:hypothetical protein